MTRLKVDDIKHIADRLPAYDRELLRKTGFSLKGMACFASGVREEDIAPLFASTRAAVVPVSGGLGVIPGFSCTIKAILEHLGFNVFVTEKNDISGIAEAFLKEAQLLFMADDRSFLALNLKRGSLVDNAAATGIGFAAGLDLLCGGLKGQEVLVLGCGPVGKAAVEWLLRAQARVRVYDIDCACSRDLVEKKKMFSNSDIKIVTDKKRAFSGIRYFIDATNAAEIIGEEVITGQTYISAPGIPLGLTPGALEKIAGRLLHDPLQIGVATMAVESLKQ